MIPESMDLFQRAFHVVETGSGASFTAQDTMRLLPIMSYLDQEFYDVGIQLSILADQYNSAYGTARKVLLVEHVCDRLVQIHRTQWQGPQANHTNRGPTLRTRGARLQIQFSDVTLWAGQVYSTYVSRKWRVKKLRSIYDYLVTRLESQGTQITDSQRRKEELIRKRLEILFSPTLVSHLTEDAVVADVLGVGSGKIMEFGQPYDTLREVKTLFRVIRPVGGSLDTSTQIM